MAMKGKIARRGARASVMGRKALLCAILALLVPAGPAAADEIFTFFQTAFLPTGATITAGETVTWEWSAGSHTVTSGVSSDPADNPGELFDEPINAANPSFSYGFTTPGVYSFFCREHETGLVGTIIVEPYTVTVGVVNNAFTPQGVRIFQGDQVLWQWIEGIHTVTSGASSDPGDNPGELFDAPSTPAQPVFIYPFEDPGLVPYFCRPHEIFGMDGTVLVQPLFIRGDVNSDGAINVADPIALLSYLFLSGNLACLDAGDANDSGSLDIADAVAILDHLFASGTPLPPPFPNPGADRTDDDLICE